MATVCVIADVFALIWTVPRIMNDDSSILLYMALSCFILSIISFIIAKWKDRKSERVHGL